MLKTLIFLFALLSTQQLFAERIEVWGERLSPARITKDDYPKVGYFGDGSRGGIISSGSGSGSSAGLSLLTKLRAVFSAAGRVKFDCKAEAICQSPTDIGLKCKIQGLYLTADEAYSNFTHADCCALEGKGTQIGTEFNGCSTF